MWPWLRHLLEPALPPPVAVSEHDAAGLEALRRKEALIRARTAQLRALADAWTQADAQGDADARR